MILFMFLSLPDGALDMLTLGNASIMEVNTDWKSLRIFIFLNLQRALNWLKNKTTKIKENLNETVKHCLK